MLFQMLGLPNFWSYTYHLQYKISLGHYFGNSISRKYVFHEAWILANHLWFYYISKAKHLAFFLSRSTFNSV